MEDVGFSGSFRGVETNFVVGLTAIFIDESLPYGDVEEKIISLKKGVRRNGIHSGQILPATLRRIQKQVRGQSQRHSNHGFVYAGIRIGL